VAILSVTVEIETLSALAFQQRELDVICEEIELAGFGHDGPRVCLLSSSSSSSSSWLSPSSWFVAVAGVVVTVDPRPKLLQNQRARLPRQVRGQRRGMRRRTEREECTRCNERDYLGAGLGQSVVRRMHRRIGVWRLHQVSPVAGHWPLGVVMRLYQCSERRWNARAGGQYLR